MSAVRWKMVVGWMNSDWDIPVFPCFLPATYCVVPLGRIGEDRKAANGVLAKYRRVQTGGEGGMRENHGGICGKDTQRGKEERELEREVKHLNLGNCPRMTRHDSTLPVQSSVSHTGRLWSGLYLLLIETEAFPPSLSMKLVVLGGSQCARAQLCKCDTGGEQLNVKCWYINRKLLH